MPPVRAPLLRIPYTDPLPPPTLIPPSANTVAGAVAALVEFLSPTPSGRGSSSASTAIPPSTTTTTANGRGSGDRGGRGRGRGKTLLLTGAGISVASGLADYRGAAGTYTLNKTYRPIYYHEFCANHEARKRYWARSFLGWTTLERAGPNAAHEAVARLGHMGVVGSVITQNVDSFHPTAHPDLPTLELHGCLRTLTCLSCATAYPRSTFQADLARLNPRWTAFLHAVLASGALATENPAERRAKGLRTNPDGDVDVPGADYSSFRYPACPTCLLAKGATTTARVVHADGDGAWQPGGSEGGVLKPSVVMFGESIPAARKEAAERAVDAADRVLVVGSSLATYSAWRLARRAKEAAKPLGILNMGGVRGEEAFFADVPPRNRGSEAVRCSVSADEVLPAVVRALLRC